MGQSAGYCECGCGERTTISRQNHARYGWVKGQPKRYVVGHQCRKRERWKVEDRGYATPCWIWQLTKLPTGYGQSTDGSGSVRMAHRVVYEQRVGPIPEDLHVDHLCRQPGCVNPDHLEPVTCAENVRRGLNCRLTDEQVRWVRETYATGACSQTSLAQHCGVTQAYISKLVRGVRRKNR